MKAEKKASSATFRGDAGEFFSVPRLQKCRTGMILVGAMLLLGGCGDDVGIKVGPAGEMTQLSGITMGQESGSTTSQAGENTSAGQTSDQGNTPGMPEAVKMTPAPRATSDAQGNSEDTSLESGESNTVSITISAAGDVTMGNYLGQDYSYSFRQTADATEDDGYFFQNVFDFFSSDDMTIVNLEGPLTTAEAHREGQTYCISGDPSYARFLTAGSIEAVSMANNHRLDYLEQGCRDTVKAVEAEGMVYAYDKNVGIYETNGIVIGIVSVNEVEQGAGVESIVKQGIETLEEQGADLILVCCHWGIEREYYPEDYQKNLGRKCIDWGADLVLGCHPHVIQGIEEYQGKYIVYSMGNFCFGANRNPVDKDCIIFQQTFVFEDGALLDDGEIRVIPCSVSSVSNLNDFKPTPATGSEAERIIGRVNEYSQAFGLAFDADGYLQ